MSKSTWFAVAIGAAIGYFVLPTVIGVVRSRLG